MRRFSLFTCLAVFLVLIFSISIYALDISAKGAVLIEAQSMDVAYEKNMNTRMPMASTTKIMTALVALENSNPDDIVTITEEMTGIEGSSIYLKPGEKLTVYELLHALMLESANDSAVALAIHVGGSVSEFVQLMNIKAKELGLVNTNFTNPHGLDNDEHYTTPYELGMIALNAMKNDSFRSLVSSKKMQIPDDGKSCTRLLINHNKLLRSYEGASGIKTGFTKKCGRCLVSSAMRNGVELIAVTLNAPDDWNDHKKLLDYGFSQYVNIELAKPGDYRISLGAINGECSSFIAQNTDGASVTLKKGCVNISAVLEANRMFPAPIQKGKTVGRIVFYNHGDEITSLPLFATDSIKEIKYIKSIFERIFK